METSNSDATYLDSGSPSLPINGGGIARVLQLPAIRFLQSPILSLLEYSGFLLPQSEYPNSETHPLLPESRSTSANVLNPSNSESGRGNAVGGNSDSGNSSNNGEVSIRIIGEQDRDEGVHNGDNGVNRDGNGNSSDDDNNNSNNSEALSSRRYIQQAARWVEQILPFWLLLLVVFIRQHLEGFVVIIYCTAILFKSNAILRKQTALKGEKKIHVLVVYSILFMLHIFGIYWWHRRDELFYPLIMVPPKAIPPFWHAVIIILVNDTMVRQTAMVLKLVLLMYYKNGRGHTFHRQARMLTLVEYALLLYRAMLPAPVWYRFFLNKDYGSLFSTLTTGLYLTFKLTSIVKKVKFFLAAFKGLFRKEINYGSYATSEQVNAAGDLCTICQEKMHAPILLRCKHIFCEDCVSEWLERERTCPLCRDVVRDAGLRSYGDGSTNLLFQLF